MQKHPRSRQSARKARAKAPLRPAVLVEDHVAEILSPDFLGERLLGCLNPRLRSSGRAIARPWCGPPRTSWKVSPPGCGARASRCLVGDEINCVVRRDAIRNNMAEHFEIEAEARLDGIYMVRTSLSAEQVRGHVFLCMVLVSTTWNGTCGASWRRCCSKTVSERPPPRGGTRWSSQRRSRRWRRPRRPASAPRRGGRYRACAPCWSTWAHWRWNRVTLTWDDPHEFELLTVLRFR
ncbi:MAG: hypothetical protein OXN89_12070 [Bryobacterales bacterium]|nr:hypothetical protein [Bryobacterales bacterium]